MVPLADPAEGCRHDRAPLRRLGIITHQPTGNRVFVLLCTECGFTVTTDELRRLRSVRRPGRTTSGRKPAWMCCS